MANYPNTTTPVSDPSEFEMPYGKHAGKPISDVPTQYLRWMYRDCNFTLFPELQRALEQYLGLPPDPGIRVGVTRPESVREAQNGAKSGPNGGTGGLTRRTPQTGLDGFRAAFERAKREVLIEYQDSAELYDMLDDMFDRVRKALGI